MPATCSPYQLPLEAQAVFLVEWRVRDCLPLRVVCHEFKECIELALTKKQARFFKRAWVLSTLLPPEVTLSKIRENDVAFYTAYNILFHRRNNCNMVDAAGIVTLTVVNRWQGRERDDETHRKLIAWCNSTGCDEFHLRHALLHRPPAPFALETYSERASRMDSYLTTFLNATLLLNI